MNFDTLRTVAVLARWRIILLLMGYAAIAHFNRVSISVAGSEVFIKEMGITTTMMGWVYTTFLIVYTTGMLPGGWLIDRIGSARALTLLGLTMGTFVALTGTLGWIFHGPEALWLGLLVIRGLAGAGNIPLHPAAAHVVSDVVTGRARATANGVVTAGALIGIACCYPVFGWLMDRLSWQWAFVVSGSALVLYGLLWQRFAQPFLPAPLPKMTAEESQANSEAGWALIHRGNVWLLTFSYAAYGYFQYLFFYWMGYYFESVLHVPEVEARRVSFYIMLAQGAGMAFGGLSTDAACRLFGTTIGRRLIVMTGMILGAVFGLMGVNVTDLWSVAGCLAIAMAATGMCEGVFWTTATDIGGKARGVCAAFMNTGGNFGGLISPVLTPFMAEKLGWPGSIAVACAISLVGGLTWFLIRPQEEGSQPTET